MFPLQDMDLSRYNALSLKVHSQLTQQTINLKQPAHAFMTCAALLQSCLACANSSAALTDICIAHAAHTPFCDAALLRFMDGDYGELRNQLADGEGIRMDLVSDAIAKAGTSGKRNLHSWRVIRLIWLLTVVVAGLMAFGIIDQHMQRLLL
jgi:hypothetical protein